MAEQNKTEQEQPKIKLVAGKDASKPKEEIKCCPFINGTYLMPVQTALGKPQIVKQTDVIPCIKDKCMFYNGMDCKVNLFLDFMIEAEQKETEEQE